VAAARSPRTSGPPGRKRGRPPGETLQGSQTKARLLEAAGDLFAERGFHGTSIADIAERVGIHRGGVYYHVNSKEDLLWQIVRTYLDAELAWMAKLDHEPLPVDARLRAMIRNHVLNIIDHHREVAINLRDGDALTGDAAKQRQLLRNRVQSVWQETIDEGHRIGVLVTADHVVVNGLLGMLNAVHFWYRPRDRDDPEQIARKLADALLNGLLRR
jgi:TetR/AcrR family transcriptional regulator, cholesterol catabolism regulator